MSPLWLFPFADGWAWLPPLVHHLDWTLLAWAQGPLSVVTCAIHLSQTRTTSVVTSWLGWNETGQGSQLTHPLRAGCWRPSNFSFSRYDTTLNQLPQFFSFHIQVIISVQARARQAWSHEGNAPYQAHPFISFPSYSTNCLSCFWLHLFHVVCNYIFSTYYRTYDLFPARHADAQYGYTTLVLWLMFMN